MSKKPTGLGAFAVVAIGQMISILGSSMTMFALSIWLYNQTESATAFSLLAVTGFGPVVLFSPIAGALVDRWNRKLVMMLSDLAAGLSTVAIFLLFISGYLEVWHMYIASFINGTFQSFQWPAYSAAITTMVPKEQYGRANGMVALAGPVSNIFAPILAAGAIGIYGFELGTRNIMILDIVTFSAAIGALLFVHVPQPKATAEGQGAQGSLLKESAFGFKYIFSRPSLLGLQLMFFYINLVASIGNILLTPLILSGAENGEATLATVMAAGAWGGVLGGLLLTAWGGPKRRIHGVLVGFIAGGLFYQILMGLGFKFGGMIELSIFGVTGVGLIWALANFNFPLIVTILNGSNQAIWQAKVPPDVQGRVFAVRRLIAQITAPIGMLAAGPLADKLFEPAMLDSTSALGSIFGPLVGNQTGSGMSLIFLITGVLGVVGALSGYLIPAIRNVEDIMPDHEQDSSAFTQQEADAAEDPAAA
jgi:DHA3 family macrolide efflux protein-like MFS transporter